MDSPGKGNFLANIASMYTSQKVNNISPDQPMQYNFANRPKLYSSSASRQPNSNSAAQNFNMMLQPAPQNDIVNPFSADQQMHAQQNAIQQVEKLFAFLHPR